MSRRKQLFLVLLGLTLAALSLALLAYALWPWPTTLEQIPLPPQPFRQPESWRLLPGGYL